MVNKYVGNATYFRMFAAQKINVQNSHKRKFTNTEEKRFDMAKRKK